MVLFSNKEAHPLRVWEPVVVEPVVSQAVPEEACIREPVHEEPVIPPLHLLSGGLLVASFLSRSYGNFTNSYSRRVVGGFLFATSHMVTLLIRIAGGLLVASFLPPVIR